jgi:hypothetical protein
MRPSVWIRNYETDEGLSQEDTETQLAMFAAADPICFEDAVKNEK